MSVATSFEGHRVKRGNRQIRLGASSTAQQGLAISTGSIDNAVVGDNSYSQQMVATGAVGTKEWESTDLPGGLFINSVTGLITGTATLPTGTYNPTIRVRTSTQPWVPRSYTMTVSATGGTLTINTAELNVAQLGASYVKQMSVSNVTGTAVWSMTVGGSTNHNLSININTGRITSGTGGMGGTSIADRHVEVTVSDDSPTPPVMRPYTLIVVQAPVSITTASPLPGATEGTLYPSVQLAHAGGEGNIKWVDNNQWPNGLSMSESGLITGTPAAGTGGNTKNVSVTVTATTWVGQTEDTKTFSITTGNDTPSAGTAPDYSAYVTRRSIGYSGAGVTNYANQSPLSVNGSIIRLDCQANSIVQAYNNTSGVTTYDWQGTDAAVKRILDAGMHVCLMPTYNTPKYSGYYNMMGVPTKNGGARSDLNGHTFDEWTTWWSTKIAKACVDRYHYMGANNPTTGVLANKINVNYCVRFFEGWNEVNNGQFWQPHPQGKQGSYILNAWPGPGYDYAELAAKCYTQMKIHPSVIVGGSGLAGGRKWPAQWTGVRGDHFYEAVLAKWAAMNYSAPTHGWADKIAMDFAGYHCYGGNSRGGGSQQNTSLNPPDQDTAENGTYVIMPNIHNALHARGFGSVKIWSTESDHGWDAQCDTGYGFRGWNDAQKGSYTQSGSTFPREDRAALSPQEAYNVFSQMWSDWTGWLGATQIAWPPQTNDGAGNRPRWNVLGKKTPAAGDPLPLGPRFHFTGSKDLTINPPSQPQVSTPHGPYWVYWHHAEHFGLWYHDGTSKAVAGVNDGIDAMLRFPKKP